MILVHVELSWIMIRFCHRELELGCTWDLGGFKKQTWIWRSCVCTFPPKKCGNSSLARTISPTSDTIHWPQENCVKLQARGLHLPIVAGIETYQNPHFHFEIVMECCGCSCPHIEKSGKIRASKLISRSLTAFSITCWGVPHAAACHGGLKTLAPQLQRSRQSDPRSAEPQPAQQQLRNPLWLPCNEASSCTRVKWLCKHVKGSYALICHKFIVRFHPRLH
jgi:hypothetical protein